MSRCLAHDDRDEVSWACGRIADHYGPHSPQLSSEAHEFLRDSEDLNEALFDLANLFRVPVTNNEPCFDEDGEPIYHVGDFIDEVKALFEHFGWEKKA